MTIERVNNKFNSNPISYDKNKTSNNSTEIDKEEDSFLYARLKAAGVDFQNHSFQWQKEHIVAFPPLTAPANVRRAFRLALQNATPEQKKAAENLTFYYNSYKQQNPQFDKTLENSVSGFGKIMTDFKNYFKGDNFESLNGFIDSFLMLTSLIPEAISPDDFATSDTAAATFSMLSVT